MKKLKQFSTMAAARNKPPALLALSIFLGIFLFAVMRLATCNGLNTEPTKSEVISHNCIDDENDNDNGDTDTDDNDECHESEMHPNLPQQQQQLRRILKSQYEQTTDHWVEQGLRHVQKRVEYRVNFNDDGSGINKPARNIIFFIGDGMSAATLAATRLYLGGEEQSLSFEKFPYTGLARTFALDRLVTDSAAAATALLCGVKTKNGIIALDGNVERGARDFELRKQCQLTSIADWALAKQKSVGLVTTTRVTDATPAALYAHISERLWENDGELKKTCVSEVDETQPTDIGLQLMAGEVGKNLKVVLGGGSAQLMPKSAKNNSSGLRNDGRNLIDEFQAHQQNIFLSTKADPNWLNVNLTENGRLLGLFGADHLPYHLEIENDETLARAVPSLAEMTAKALEILQGNEDGYFLLVEAGKIDLAHHENRAKLAIDETAELGKAVTKALGMTNEKDTLIVVTADHGHTMSIAGYASRSGDVFGISNGNAADELPYKILTYANGPSYYGYHDEKSRKRFDLNAKKPKLPSIDGNGDEDKDENDDEEESSSSTKAKNFESFPATVPLKSATHGGEDVPVFAHGPWSYLFSGVYDQSTIPHLLAFASCLNVDESVCRRDQAGLEPK